MAPETANEARLMFRKSLGMMLASYSDDYILLNLKQIDRLVAEDQVYDALKSIRSLYSHEAEILNPGLERNFPAEQKVGAI
jgi:flagellar protein FlbT